MIMENRKGKTEIVNTPNQKCVRGFEIPSVIAMHQCGPKCICENCYASFCQTGDGTESVQECWYLFLLKCALC